jgi:glycosyltransferase involved in cell wall biosynthesis
MTSLRLVLVTPRYWPLAGETEFASADLAEGLTELGIDVTVLTGSWWSGWPRSMALHGVRVVRVPHAPRGGWGTFRYLTAISRWLRSHQADFDLVYVMGLRFEAYATVSALRRSTTPVVLRAHEGGTTGDGEWQAHARWGARVKQYCLQAHGIVVPNATIKSELAQLGYASDRLHEIAWGVASAEPRSASRRYRARVVLAEANRDLAVPEYAPVALFAGRLDERDEILRLVEDWRVIAARWPTARLWIIGDGPTRDWVGERLIDWDLRYQVMMPGAFEDWSDLFLAADVFVWPAEHGGRQTILRAMSAGLPVVAGESADLRGMIEPGTHGLLVARDEPGAWSSAIGELLEAPQLAAQMGAEASKRVNARYPRRAMAEAHVELMEQFLSR